MVALLSYTKLRDTIGPLLVDAAGLSSFLAPLAFPECLFARHSISRVAGFNLLEIFRLLPPSGEREHSFLKLEGQHPAKHRQG